MQNLIIILTLLAILGGAAYYVYRTKRRGQKCVGCPYCGGCNKACHTER